VTYLYYGIQKVAGRPCPALLALASMLASAAATDLPGLNASIMLVNTSTVSWAKAL
tara:strand:- start:154 stop:321 length:168 start_codon:yes stop_codon:yes gene_type:complete